MKRPFHRVIAVAVALVTATISALGASPAHAENAHVTSLTPIEIVSTGTFPSVYVLGTMGCARPSCLRLISTNVDGERDTPAELPPLHRSSEGLGGTTLQSLSFANGGQGYALVGTTSSMSLYVTRDGAESWHKVPALPGVSFQRITVTGSVVYATMAKCTSFDDHCVDVTIAKSALWPIHWTAMRLPTIPNNGLNGGIPEVSADVTTVWLSEIENNAEVIWRSTNEGTTFHETTEPRMVSIHGCGLELITPADAWAQCPTGMLVSFYYSSDGGAQWVSVPQRPYAGTSGGFFAPSWNSVAYIDYGQTPNNFYRVNMRDDVAVHVGELNCDITNSPVFIAGGGGLVVCTVDRGDSSSSALYSTSDGGALWRKIRLET
ncbi:MAG: hypothetical protein WA359_05650 [Acidimicrobiales bacterium]